MIVSQLVLYSGLLYIVYKISYESRDPISFDLKNHVSKMFTFLKTYFGAGYDEETRIRKIS
ncbi:hypothetical protein DPMN_024195 [Dreissena polymorpha]|uniref:Uncharacterized protein n=1 Tax=Dreissena polymorpha TaxID=45954 RepID=A0A9D4RBD7_DREPO|nr:hypothetical protein DPMN_024195 [Dreissena polymorpha]